MEKYNLLMSRFNNLTTEINDLSWEELSADELKSKYLVALNKTAKRFYTKPFYDSEKPIMSFILEAQNEIDSYLINKNTTELIQERVEIETIEVVENLRSIFKLWEMGHVRHKGIYMHDFAPYVQPIFEFYDWFLLKCGLEENTKKQETEKDDIFKKSPFNTRDAFDVFSFLNSNYNNKKKVRWTHIHDFLKEECKFVFSIKPYFQFIKENYESVAIGRQETADKNTSLIQLGMLYTDFVKRDN